MKRISIKLSLIVLIFWLTSCSSFIQVDPPDNLITGDAVFLQDATAIAAVNGCYSRLTATSLYFANGGSSIFLAMYADEVTTTLTTANYREFANSALTTTNSIVYNNFWRNPYEIIYQVNRNILGLQTATNLTQKVKEQLLGECYFLRAFCYLYLVNLFGDVPLIKGVNYDSNAISPRNDVSEVYALIKDDLLTARSILSTQYPSSGKFRANKYAACALLARMSLYQKQWKDAENYSSEIINSGAYSLPDPSSAFLDGSSESIWQLTIDGQTFNTHEGRNFVPNSNASTLPSYPLTSTLLSAFESGDLRYKNWIGSKTVKGEIYFFPYKYKVIGTAVNEKIEQPIVLRLGEQFLIRAEARAQQNNLTGANDDLTVIRQRAGLPGLKLSDSQSGLLSNIMKERQIELFAEYGFHWFDLKRTGSANVALSYKPQWKTTGLVFPIPESEIVSNPKLTQNYGY